MQKPSNPCKHGQGTLNGDDDNDDDDINGLMYCMQIIQRPVFPIIGLIRYEKFNFLLTALDRLSVIQSV